MAHPQAGSLPTPQMLENLPKLISDFFLLTPDPSVTEQRVTFGTSGHRGSSKKRSFNHNHILAITQAICDYRKANKIEGKLFVGKDTHALSYPAELVALSVLAANGVETYIAEADGYTPTPAISHAILTHNRSGDALCDGIVITPSHNPPSDGGFKYNTPNGGPADTDVTKWIEDRANAILENGLQEVKSLPLDETHNSPFVHTFDFVSHYVEDLPNVIDIEAIRKANIKIGADALGGSGMAYYKAIKERYGLNMTLLHDNVDERFAFMHLDHDGKIRMDCSSPYAMRGLVDLKDDYDIAFGNDTDFDRHGIVTPKGGLMNPNHFLAVAIWYLSTHRKAWKDDLKIGKTVVSSSMIDRVVKSLGKTLYEVPVGFKWYVEEMYQGKLAFGGEESAGASFLRFDGTPWSTDKDGIIMALLSAEILAETGRDPADIYAGFAQEYGMPIYARIDVPCKAQDKAILKKISPSDLTADTLAGEPIEEIMTHTNGNGAAIGGLKVVAPNGWFAVRPSGTEDVYKIYAESFKDEAHLKAIQEEAQAMLQTLFESHDG